MPDDLNLSQRPDVPPAPVPHPLPFIPYPPPTNATHAPPLPHPRPLPRPHSPPVPHRPVLPERTRKTGNPRLAPPRSPAARPEGAGENNVHKGRANASVRTVLPERQRELRRHCTDPGERPVD